MNYFRDYINKYTGETKRIRYHSGIYGEDMAGNILKVGAYRPVATWRVDDAGVFLSDYDGIPEHHTQPGSTLAAVIMGSTVHPHLSEDQYIRAVEAVDRLARDHVSDYLEDAQGEDSVPNQAQEGPQGGYTVFERGAPGVGSQDIIKAGTGPVIDSIDLSDESPWLGQVGGEHYRTRPDGYQPFQISHALGLTPVEHTILKYLLRHRTKHGEQDLQKIKHCVDLLIDLEYKE